MKGKVREREGERVKGKVRVDDATRWGRIVDR